MAEADADKDAQSSGSSGAGILSAFTDLGDKLHKNFQQTLNSRREYDFGIQDRAEQREQTLFNRIMQNQAEITRKRETAFNQGMTTRQMADSEKNNALKRRAEEYALRKSIENDDDREGIAKNFMIGMMSSVNSLGGKRA